ncbi:MAG: hypothetical protein NTY38_15325 [Acidobacteria bacterium]|nr:hypothetical protein [Acidobacteriota bacterium]
MKRTLAVGLVALGFVCRGAQPDGLKVWVVDESVRVDPVESRAVDDRPALFPDGLPENYREANFVWDGAAKVIRLKAARNGVIGFQIVVERTGSAKLTKVRAELGDLAGPGGRRIAAGRMDLYKEWYVHVEKPSRQSYTLGRGWYPDALLPCQRWSGNLYPHTYVHPFEIPGRRRLRDAIRARCASDRTRARWRCNSSLTCGTSLCRRSRTCAGTFTRIQRSTRSPRRWS